MSSFKILSFPTLTPSDQRFDPPANDVMYRPIGDGGSNGGGGMDGYAREADLRELKAKVEATLPHLATKADLSSLESTLIKWFVGTAIAAVGLAAAISFGVARFVL